MSYLIAGYAFTVVLLGGFLVYSLTQLRQR